MGRQFERHAKYSDKYNQPLLPYKHFDKLVSNLPAVRTLGESLLSILKLDEGADGWGKIEKAASKGKATAFLSILRELADAPDRHLLKGMYNNCLNYLKALATRNVCHKDLDVRLEPCGKVDRYILYALFEKLCRACFGKLQHAELCEFLLWLLQEEGFSRYVYATLARLDLEQGNIESAFGYAQKSGDYDYFILYISHLYYDIGMAAKEAGINLESPVALDDLSGYVCRQVFDDFTISKYNFSTNTTDVKVCFCSKFATLYTESSKELWNSRLHQKVRAAVLDGSYRYCNRHTCPAILEGRLEKKEVAKVDLRMKEIIENNRVVIDTVNHVILAYDRDCNLACPSCRTSFFHLSKEQVAVLDDFADREILPLLKTASMLTLSGTGEALTSPHSVHVLKKLSRKDNPNLKITLFTNGAADIGKIWNNLGEAASMLHKIRVSIDGAERETFEKLRYPAKWDALLQTMNFYSKLRLNGTLSNLHVNFVIQMENYRQLTKIFRLCVDWNVNMLVFSRMKKYGNTSSYLKNNDVFFADHPFHGGLLEELDNLKSEIALQSGSGCDVFFQ